jgi:hypothetical protein
LDIKLSAHLSTVLLELLLEQHPKRHTASELRSYDGSRRSADERRVGRKKLRRGVGGALLDSEKHAHLPRDSGNAATRKDKRPHDQIFGT